MPVESFTFIDSLNANNPVGSTDKVQTLDDHVRGIKSTIKATFPNITGAVTPTHTELNFVDGVTSAIQTQLDNKLATNGAGTSLTGVAKLASANTFTGGKQTVGPAAGASVAAYDVTLNINAHAVYGYLDNSVVDLPGGVTGHASFASHSTYVSDDNANHHHDFQAMPTFDFEGDLVRSIGFVHQPLIVEGQFSERLVGFEARPPVISGPADIAELYGFYAVELTDGDTNWAFYAGGSTPSRFGRAIFGDEAAVPVALGSVAVLSGSAPSQAFIATGADADDGIWDFFASAGDGQGAFTGRVLNDAINAATNWMQVVRNGLSVVSIALNAATLSLTGAVQTPNSSAAEVGKTGAPSRNVTASGNTAASDQGGAIRFTGGSGQTFTLDSDLPADTFVILVNQSGNSWTIAASGTLTSAGATGSRTLPNGCMAAAYHAGFGNYHISGQLA